MTARSFGMPFDPKHTATIGTNSWDGEWSPRCSCGWRGIRVDSPGRKYVEGLEEIREAYGVETLLKNVYGDGDTSMIQVLHHLNYDPVVDLDGAVEAYELVVSYLSPHRDSEELEKLAEHLKEASYEIVEARKRARVWVKEPLPVLPAIPPEVRRLADLALAKLSNRPMSDEDAKALEEGMAKVAAILAAKREDG